MTSDQKLLSGADRPGWPLLTELIRDLATGRVTSRALIEQALDAAALHPHAFTLVDVTSARAAADAADQRRTQGATGALSGIPISVKDLFDIKGQPTPAGSLILRDSNPAARDATAVARLRGAGCIVIGRTHMSEFAFSGLGVNPHLPQPVNPCAADRVPGGSSSGAAVAVARGACVAALGTDTGGSLRIPAAFCGLTAFKPTQHRVSRTGVVPLAASLDCVGPIARSIDDCRLLFAALSKATLPFQYLPSVAGLRLGVPIDVVLDDLDDTVASAFAATLAALSQAGATISDIPFPEFRQLTDASRRTGIVHAEAFAWHRRHGFLDRRKDYDPNVLIRIESGQAMSAADYLDLIDLRQRMGADADRRTAPFDALILPTVPIVAPRFSALVSREEFARINSLVLRNTAPFNMLDRCAATLPMHAPDALPAGLMLVGARNADQRLLAIAKAVETVLARRRPGTWA